MANPASFPTSALRRFSLCAFLALSISAGPAAASDYLIEAVVFAWANGPQGDETFETRDGETVQMPKFGKAPDNLVVQVQPSLLADEVQRMRSAGAIDVLEHLAWTQSRAGKRGSPQVDLGSATGGRIQGWVRLYTNTYLFADVDLAFTGGGGSAATSTVQSNGTVAYTGGYNTSVMRLNEHRRVKFNELHYFDHPKFGVLLTISPNR